MSLTNWTQRLKIAQAPKVSRPRRYASSWGIFLFLLPGLGIYTLLMLYPSLLSLYFSLLNWQGGPIAAAPVVGLANFAAIAKDQFVGMALTNNGRVLLFNWAFQLPMALLLASVLSRLRNGAAFYRFVFYIPVVLPTATLALMWRFIFSGSDYGLLNNVLRGLGLDALIRPWLSGDGVVQWTTTFPSAWQHVGFFMVIFLAALAAIPEEYYEAAAIDGANGWQQLRYVTLPGLRPVYVSAMILGLQGALGSFIYPVLMTKGGPLHLSETLISYSLYLLWVKNIWGYGSAVAVMSFLLGIVAVMLVWRFGREREAGLYR
jgi:raffinose/stachyose/melibiose transport system permease protein